MSKLSRRVPSYQNHRSGQARVSIRGKTYYLGKYGTPESHEKYDELIKEHVLDQAVGLTAKSLTAILAAYWPYCQRKYGRRGKGKFGGAVCYRPTIRLLREHFGSLQADAVSCPHAP